MAPAMKSFCAVSQFVNQAAHILPKDKGNLNPSPALLLSSLVM